MYRFTKEQMKVLKPFERQFYRAVYQQWCRNAQRDELELMWKCYREATGSNEPLSVNCGACVLDVITRVGAIYFATQNTKIKKAIREKMK